jgi:hypothetical protein
MHLTRRFRKTLYVAYSNLHKMHKIFYKTWVNSTMDVIYMAAHKVPKISSDFLFYTLPHWGIL